MKILLILMLSIFLPLSANAEGSCPPGHYPIGGQGVQGCAPIPGGSGGGASTPPVATGKWESRWGAIAEESAELPDGASIPTGVSESKKSKREASAAAIAECERVGGRRCVILLIYKNQCAALADPKPSKEDDRPGRSAAGGAGKMSEAEALAISHCERISDGQRCAIVYAGCSMSEFKSFK